MSREVATVNQWTSLQEAVRKMNERGIGCLVVESKGELVGILTERDIVRLVENGRSLNDLTVMVIMSSPPKVIEQDQTIQEASRLMYEERIRRLPAVKNGRLVGIITSTDIIQAAKDGIFLRESDSLPRGRHEDEKKAITPLLPRRQNI